LIGWIKEGEGTGKIVDFRLQITDCGCGMWDVRLRDCGIGIFKNQKTEILLWERLLAAIGTTLTI
jgi:hypothetical protein